MNQTITEKTYPIEARWAIKSASSIWLGMIVYIVLFSAGLFSDEDLKLMIILGYVFIMAIVFSIWPFLYRKTFGYTLDEKFLIVKQGIISRQERHFPYGVIQDVSIRQDILDRIFGIVSLIIQNASQDGIQPQPARPWWSVSLRGSSKHRGEEAGAGNTISIPGLSAKNAGLLKEAILQKMKENPMDDTHSGL